MLYPGGTSPSSKPVHQAASKEFPRGPGVRTCCCHYQGPGLMMLGWETKIPQAMWHGQNKLKKKKKKAAASCH